jgi:hypothetical protein
MTQTSDASTRKPMVGWYDPAQLIRTGCDVAASTLFGRHADFRLMEAVSTPNMPIDEVGAGEHGDVWIDYIADTGDGWNSTYAVAYNAAADTLTVAAADGVPHATRRGDMLVFGGDAVYPVATRAEYKARLVAPFEAAFPKGAPNPPLVRAVPGNHDWYDSLVAFTRLFTAHDNFAGWRAKQSRSYFAVRLPRGWWLVGTDMQLDSDIDLPQVEFMKRVEAGMAQDDRVILCNAEPHWIAAHLYGEMNADVTENNLKFLEDVVFKGRIAVFLAGDLHHYRRHEAPDGRQKITAGGGGAFLHPTHAADVSLLADGFALKATFPPVEVSRKLCWGNLAFLARNWKFGVVPAALYLMTAWSGMTDISRTGDIDATFREVVNAFVKSPVAAFWALALFLGFWLFTDTHSKTWRFVGGTVHALAHMAAVFFLGWGATVLTVKGFGLAFASTAQLVTGGALIFVGGWIAGSVILGLYLLISLNGFGRHHNEAFSSLKIEDWKHFLRLRIDAAGDLTIFPIGIERVPRQWRTAGAGSRSRDVPDDARATPPALIEPPIAIRRSAGASATPR